MMFSVVIPLFFALTWRLLYASNGTVEIERHNVSYRNGELTFQPDTFKILSEMCSSDISAYCEAMGGHSVDGCKCKCNSERTTFGFYDGQWNCTANSRVRHHGGCSLVLLSGRTNDSALLTLPLNLTNDLFHLMPTDHQRCYIIPFQSTYLLCNGSWTKLDNNFTNKRFIMVGGNGPQFLKMKKSTWDLEYNDVKGRILRIRIACYDMSSVITRHCLLLKMQGKLKCPQFALPPILKPTTSTSINKFQTESIQTSMSHPTTEGPSSFVNKGKKNEENDSGNTGLIAGLAVGVFGLTLIIVAIVIFSMRRRRKRKTKAKDRVSKQNPQTDEDGSHEIYTYANAISTENVNDEVQSSRDHGKISTSNEFPYHEKPCPKDPNTIADYANQTILNDSELEYELMVGDTENDDYVNQGNSNLNVSEDCEYEIFPNTDNNDRKNIKQEEVYTSLVGNVPHVYGSLKGPRETYKDEVDRQVTCTSQNNEDNIYQQLNAFSQQSQDEYQAPNYKSQ